MNEIKLEITEQTSKKDGQVYKNIDPKEKLKAELNGKMVMTEEYALDGNYITVEKVFDKGREFKHSKDGRSWSSFSCRVNYIDEEVSFWLGEYEHEAYEVLGEAGSKIKITGEKSGKYFNLKFELLE